MKIMVVGGGGREHALIKKLKESKKITKIYALPGNGGIAADAECVNIGAKDIPAIVEFATANKIDYAVVAPDDPLVLGAVDALERIGRPVADMLHAVDEILHGIREQHGRGFCLHRYLSPQHGHLPISMGCPFFGILGGLTHPVFPCP